MTDVLIPIVVKAELVEGNTVEAALRELLREDRDPRLEPTYMPEIIDGRNKYGPKESSNWRWLTAPSIRAMACLSATSQASSLPMFTSTSLTGL